jgi:hypothetical protein
MRRRFLGGLLRSSGIAFISAAGFFGSATLAVGDSDSLGPGDFAIGRILEAKRPGVLHSVMLDYDVYRRSVEPGLADLRVFDEEGRPAPYAIRRRVPATKTEAEWVDLPIFPLGGSVADSAPGLEGKANAYRIDAQLSESGAILSVRREGSMGVARAGRSGWLLDSSHLKETIVALQFGMGTDGGDFLSRMRVESSNDLSRFSAVEAEIALARLVHEGHRIERTEFEIPATKARYLRITPIDAAPAADLTRVRVRLAPKTVQRTRQRHTIEGRFDPGEPGVVVYELDANLPVEALRILLVEPNTIIEGQLESASTPEGPWRTRQGGVFYFFEKGGELRNASVAWRSSSDRHLRLVTSRRGGGLLGEPPMLEVVWRPEQLLYVQRGPGHSFLAVGRAGTADGSFSPADLLRTRESEKIDLFESSASLGPEAVLAGESVLERKTPPPWRTYGLWALLLLSVGVVLALSFRLLSSASD